MKYAKGGIVAGKQVILPEPEEFIIPHGQRVKISGLDDIVQVVRCKNCVHRKEKVCFNPSAGMWVGVELKDSDFCSYGERREGE